MLPNRLALLVRMDRGLALWLRVGEASDLSWLTEDFVLNLARLIARLNFSAVPAAHA